MASASGNPLSLTNFSLKSRTSTTSNIECRVCEDVFTVQGDKVPRLLHCGHTLCHQCLTRLPLTGKTMPTTKIGIPFSVFRLKLYVGIFLCSIFQFPCNYVLYHVGFRPHHPLIYLSFSYSHSLFLFSLPVLIFHFLFLFSLTFLICTPSSFLAQGQICCVPSTVRRLQSVNLEFGVSRKTSL